MTKASATPAKIIMLTSAQLHSLVGTMYEQNTDTPSPLALATSTLFHAAEELRVFCTAIIEGGGDKIEIGNALYLVASRLQTVSELCEQLGKANGGSL